MKAGIKSTEFWLSLAALVVKAVFPDDFPNEALLAVIGYTLSRGFAKWGSGKKG